MEWLEACSVGWCQVQSYRVLSLETSAEHFDWPSCGVAYRASVMRERARLHWAGRTGFFNYISWSLRCVCSVTSIRGENGCILVNLNLIIVRSRDSSWCPLASYPLTLLLCITKTLRVAHGGMIEDFFVTGVTGGNHERAGILNSAAAKPSIHPLSQRFSCWYPWSQACHHVARTLCPSLQSL